MARILDITTEPPIVRPTRARVILTQPRRGKAAEQLTDRGERFVGAAFELLIAEEGDIELPEAATITVERVEIDGAYQIELVCEFIRPPDRAALATAEGDE